MFACYSYCLGYLLIDAYVLLLNIDMDLIKEYHPLVFVNLNQQST